MTRTPGSIKASILSGVHSTSSFSDESLNLLQIIPRLLLVVHSIEEPLEDILFVSKLHTELQPSDIDRFLNPIKAESDLPYVYRAIHASTSRGNTSYTFPRQRYLYNQMYCYCLLCLPFSQFYPGLRSLDYEGIYPPPLPPPQTEFPWGLGSVDHR